MLFSVVGVTVLTMVMDGVHFQLRARGDATNSFAGSNLHFLHALPQAQQKAYIETLAGWEVKVIRLWGESIRDVENNAHTN